MPRKPRFFLPDVPVHMIIRGNNRQTVFAEHDDYAMYHDLLKTVSARYECRVHAYVLMTNHIHLLLNAHDISDLSKLPQAVGRQYVPYFNYKYGKTGTLWEGRFKATSIDSEQYLLSCYRYIEENPLRAKMVNKCGDYRWSSYHVNALGGRDELVTPHPIYQSLGSNKKQRQKAYLDLFDKSLTKDTIDDIRQSAQTGTPLGNNKFKEEIEKLLKVKVGYAKRGRPRIKGY